MVQTGPTAVPADGALEIDLTVRLAEASNVTLGARLGGSPVVYKPRAGERVLHDFAHGTLANREVAAYLIAVAGGWEVIPPTALRDGPLGPGSAQCWVEHTDESATGDAALRVVDPTEVPEGWLPVVAAETPEGEQVLIVHPDDEVLRSIAVLDEVLNNADRKASHLLRSPEGRWWAIDNGLSLHQDDKLRTVLWGWTGDALLPADLVRLQQLHRAAEQPPWAGLISAAEHTALRQRIETLLQRGTHSQIPVGRYPLPWPLW